MENRLLWAQFISGDDKAYSILYERYVDILFSYGMGFTPNRELVKDCIQDIFIRIFSHRKHLKEIDNVKLYLFIALKNALFNYFKRDESFRQVYWDEVEFNAEEPVFDVAFSVEDVIITGEEKEERTEQINRMILGMLTSRQKEVIYYRYIEEMDLDMICELMKMNYQSVLNLMQRSIKRIRTLYDIEKENYTLKGKFMKLYLYKKK
jgi:RNA polymerase sigma factor (sigma-70 family)